MVRNRDSPYSLSGCTALGVLEKELTATEVETAQFLERPQYATSLIWSVTEIVEKPHSAIEFQVTERLAELVLGESLAEVSVRVCGPGYDARVNWEQFCYQTSDEAEAIRIIVGERVISLLRLAYHWPRAKWFQPVALDAVRLLLQELR